MKLVYSFWSPPLMGRWKKQRANKRLEDLKTSTYNCMLLSVLLARKWGFRVEIVTDNKGEELLRGVPCDKITTELEFVDSNSESWVQGKLMAIALQKEPFIHIDWDVFLLKPEIVKILKNFKTDLLVQSIDGKEAFDFNYMAGVKELSRQMDFTNHYIPGLHALHEYNYNCGVMGFNNMKLKDEFVSNFLKCWRVSDATMPYDNSLIIEQGLLYAMVNDHGYTCETILPKSNQNQVAKKIGYTHLLYISKYTKKNQIKIKAKIKKEFPQFYKLIEPEKKKLKAPLLSLCTVVMNRKDHALKTIKANYSAVKNFKGLINMYILDYNSSDGLVEDLKKETWFVEGMKSNTIRLYQNSDAKTYHRTLPKNKIHEVADGQYLVNIDADNFAKKEYLEFVLNHIKYSNDFYIRPDKTEAGDGFGKILLSNEDFKALGGYNLNISGYGFEDNELIIRLKLLGRKLITASKHMCGGNITHTDEERMNIKGELEAKKALMVSEHSNRRLPIQLHPNKNATIDCQIKKINL